MATRIQAFLATTRERAVPRRCCRRSTTKPRSVQLSPGSKPQTRHC